MAQARSKAQWILEALSLAALILTFGIVATHWPELPATIPIHFGASGRANGFGGKSMLILLCVVNAGTWVS
jgi:uncharacterized membrane protein